MGVRHWTILLVFLISFSFAYADTSRKLATDCAALCAKAAADDTIGWKDVDDCFAKTLNNADAHLATATCAYNNNADDAAEDYALKSARAKFEWMAFLRRIPGVSRVWKTGGIGETYVLAYSASGGARHQSKAMQYLKTSGQCMNSDDREACAEQYFNSVVRRYESRNIQAARVSGPAASGHAFRGRITDYYDKPVRQAKVTLICGRNTWTNYTDANGYYNFPVPAKVTPADICTEAKLYVKFQYHDPEDRSKIYYRIMWRGQPVWVMKKFKLRGLDDLKQDFKVDKGLSAPDYHGRPRSRDSYAYAVMHQHMSEVLEFYKDHLKIDIDYKLPVDVFPARRNSNTYYTSTTSSIVIDIKDTSPFDSDRPKNREWHEFNHHAMFSLYRKWPQPAITVPAEKNHDGFMNPTTSDSFVEGFAEFMSLVIADHYKEPSPDVYAAFGSLDVDKKAYGNRGYDEELAVAAVLWDLYDPKNDDQVDLTFPQIWNVIKVYHADFTSVHDAFVKKFPGFKDEIDEIFKKHGFFRDKTKGSGNWTPEEPFRDANGNKWWDAGEYYIDFAQERLMAYPYMIWQEGENIGSASNYERPRRTNTVRTPGHYIKVDNEHKLYTVKVEFKDNPQYNYETITDNEEGNVFVHVPSAEYDATVTVTPYGIDDAKELVFSSQKFHEKAADVIRQGYFTSYDFGIAGTPDDEFEPQELDFECEPYWETQDLTITDADFEYVAPPETDDFEGDGIIPGSFPTMYVIIAVVGIALILGLVFMKKGKKKKTKGKRKKR